FLQAEDGIRDFHVTGVQTCALPIFVADAARGRDAAAQRLAEDPCLCVDGGDGRRAAVVGHEAAVDAGELRTGSAPFRAGCRGLRSDERRVGKERRWPWWQRAEETDG